VQQEKIKMGIELADAKGTIHINRLHFPVSTLGYGRRIAVWVQGCSLHCPGCISRDTWEHGHGEIALSALTSNLETWLSDADGLTVTGGEPFEQPAALVELLQWWRKHHTGDILVFSGYSWEHLKYRHADLIQLIDVVISDPYEAEAGHSMAYRGSDNQRLHLLTDLATKRYFELPDQRALDLCWDGDRLWMAGIPHPDDLMHLHQRLQAQGLAFRSSDQPALEVLP